MRRMAEVQTLIGTLDPNMHTIRFHIGRIQDDFHHVDFKPQNIRAYQDLIIYDQINLTQVLPSDGGLISERPKVYQRRRLEKFWKNVIVDISWKV